MDYQRVYGTTAKKTALLEQNCQGSRKPRLRYGRRFWRMIFQNQSGCKPGLFVYSQAAPSRPSLTPQGLQEERQNIRISVKKTAGITNNI